jgi:signal transduction histidine kinase
MAYFDAADVARCVAELYEAAAEEAGFGIDVPADEPLPVHGSRELLGQAVANLIDNALKYGAPQAGAAAGPITVSATRDLDCAVITVADRGPGIPAAERGRVLERFVRLEAARSRPGFGLGLSLAAAVARLHGGTLRLEDNAPGLRAVLSVSLQGGLPAPPAREDEAATENIDRLRQFPSATQSQPV